MSPLNKFIIIMLSILLALLTFIGIWFVLYGIPALKSHDIVLHNVREDMSAVTYSVNGIDNTLKYGDSVSVSVKNNTTISQKTTPSTEIVLTFSTVDYTDIYFFNGSIQTNTTTLKLNVTNTGVDTVWIWLWISQTPASISNIDAGKTVSFYTYTGQQLAFTQSSNLNDNEQVFMFTPTSVTYNKISVNNGVTILG